MTKLTARLATPFHEDRLSASDRVWPPPHLGETRSGCPPNLRTALLCRRFPQPGCGCDRRIGSPRGFQKAGPKRISVGKIDDNGVRANRAYHAKRDMQICEDLCNAFGSRSEQALVNFIPRFQCDVDHSRGGRRHGTSTRIPAAQDHFRGTRRVGGTKRSVNQQRQRSIRRMLHIMSQSRREDSDSSGARRRTSSAWSPTCARNTMSSFAAPDPRARSWRGASRKIPTCACC